MKTVWTVKEKSKGELIVTVGGEDWKNAQSKAFDKLAKDIEIPGFRKGTAPKNMVKNHVNPQSILMEAVDVIASDALVAGVTEHELNLVARPELGLDAISEEEVTLKFIIITRPEVTLGEYKDLDIKKAAVKVTAKEVDAKMTSIQEGFAELVVKEGTVENTNTAVIDFEGFLDGVAFEGGKGENYPLVIGSNSFIPGFEEQLVGMGVEEQKDITVTFPEAYQAENLAGKEVVFKVTVHEIKERQLPELNDEFAKELKRDGVETLEELKKSVKEEIKQEKTVQAEQEFDNKILTAVVEGATVEIPEVMITEETDNMVADFGNRLQQQGFSLKQYTELTGQTEEVLREQMAKDAENKVKVRLVLDAVAKAENLNPTTEEIEKEYQDVATMYNMEVEKVKEMVSEPTISYDLKIRKAYDFIKSSVK